MSATTAVSPSAIQQWIALNLDIDTIREELRKHGHDDHTIETHVQEFKKAKYGKRQFTGFVLMGMGAFLGFISCLLSILNPVPELYYYILYGLTSIAIGIICVGMYFVFE